MTGPIPDFHSDPLFKGTKANFLQHHVNLHNSGVGMIPITWCRENCKGAWGWFFKPGEPESTAYMAFSNTEDALKFKLIMI